MGASDPAKDGWKASFGYRPDFVDLFGTYPPPAAAENLAGKEVWELYDVNSDPTEVHDLARSNPAKLEELKALFAAEAEANQVYPLINQLERPVPAVPGLLEGAQRLRPGADTMNLAS